MNYLLYNNEFIAENNFTINPLNRALNYGDGLFETMILKEGKLLYTADHLKRISEGLAVLDIELPSSITEETLTQKVLTLAQKNNLPKNARVKLQVWRKAGGLVVPESSEADFLITTTELKKIQEVKTNAFLSEKNRLYPGALSKYKTLNFLPYIQAGLEKKQRKADEIILTDLHGNVAEASSSNLFWCKDDVLYTPALETGCIEGVMRKQIKEFCATENIKVVEGLFPYKEVQNAELVFTSNVSGLSLVETLNEKKITTQYTLYQVIRIGLDLL